MRRGVPGGGGGRGEQEYKTLCVQRYTHGIMRGPRLKHPRTAKSPLLPALPRTDGSRRFQQTARFPLFFRSFRTLVPTRGARASSSCSLASSRHAPRARARVARTSAGLYGFWPSLWRNRLGGRDEFRSRSRTIGCRNEICVKLLEGVYSLLNLLAQPGGESARRGASAGGSGEETSPKHAGVKYQLAVSGNRGTTAPHRLISSRIGVRAPARPRRHRIGAQYLCPDRRSYE